MALKNSKYYDCLQMNIEHLFNGAKIGSSTIFRADINTKPNKYLEETKGYKHYHFCLKIPYAGRELQWDIIFDPEDYSILPDFDFNDNSFLPEPDINYIAENVPSWEAWDLTNSDSVINILNEFMILYKKAQIEKLIRLNKYAVFKEQYEELLELLNITPDDVEVYIETVSENEYANSETLSLINFLIMLPIDFSQLPEYYQEELVNPGEDYAHLSIQIRKLDNSQNKVSLFLCPKAEHLLSKLKVPKFRKDMTLSEYSSIVKMQIENQISLIVQQHEARQLFLSAIAESFSTGVVQYDATKFQKIVFLYEEIGDYSVLVHVNLTGKFPLERPRVQIHSVYCQAGKNCVSSVIFHNYDPQAQLQENISNLREVLHEDVMTFQNHKH